GQRTAAASSTGRASPCRGEDACCLRDNAGIAVSAAAVFDILLYQPEIPPNTGNVIRLCANTGARLHLIAPLGFDLDDRNLRRAGLDYHEYATLQVHESLDVALAAIAPPRLFALSTRNSLRFDVPRYVPGDAFLFGSESRGLPDDVLASVP